PSFTTPRTLADADPVLKDADLAGPAARPPVRANSRIRPGTRILVFILHLTKFITSGDETRPARLRSRLLHDESGSAQNILGVAGLVRNQGRELGDSSCQSSVNRASFRAHFVVTDVARS